MAGRHGRVSCEYALMTNGLDFCLPGTPTGDPFEKADCQKRRMAFIHVIATDIFVPKCIEQLRATQTEHRFLHKPVPLITAIEFVCETPVVFRIFGDRKSTR